MLSDLKDLLKKVRKIEIKTRRLSNNIFGGEYHSAFKGRGMTFSEVRNYQFGDDIRTIDWNVTARYNEPFVKVFEEERELTLMLLVDVSGSELFGTDNVLKKNIVTEISATLAFSALQNNDKVGLILFSGAGFALVGELSRSQLYIVVFCIWVYQLSFSSWWMSRYNFGPFEWIWRGLTYSKFPKLIKAK